MLNPKWLRRFLKLAEQVAIWSKDRSTAVGCVIVDDSRTIRSTGYNGFPRGVNDDLDERHERPTKYYYTCHAEQNAVAQAARMGVSTDGCIAICTHCPCSRCATTLIQAGIKAVYWGEGVTVKNLGEEYEIVFKMFDEAGVIFGRLT